jgi:probable F420-dependent oxidoreductase
MALDIGRIGIFTAALEKSPSSAVQDIAAEVEELGYGCLWIPETVGDALITATLALSGTSRMTVATGISSIWSRDAVAMAGAQRRLAAAFPNRFLLGLGVSHDFMVEGIRQQTYTKPLSRMSAYLDEMDDSVLAAMRMDKVAEEGLEALLAELTDPIPARPLRVLAALGSKMLQLSADKADGAHPYFQNPDHTHTAREIIGPDRLLAPEQMVILDNDPTTARAAARRVLALYSFLPNFVAHFGRLGFTEADLDDDGSDRLIDAVFAWGDLDTITKRIAEQFDAGADHVAIQVITDRWPNDTPTQSWRELATALMGV